MGLEKIDWMIISLVSGGAFNETAGFLKGSSCPIEKLGGMEKFLQSCERGERIGLKGFGVIKDLKTKHLSEDLSNYAEAFSSVAKGKEVAYYLTHLSRLREGNKESAQILYGFFNKLFHHAESQKGSYAYGWKFAA